MKKAKDVLNKCGHRNSERVEALEALKKLPSSVCPACLFKRIKELEAELKKHHWIPVSERVPEREGSYLVLCEGKIREVKIRISEDEWEDNEGKSILKETVHCDIEHLGGVLIGHDECITHWKPILSKP